MNFRFYWRLSFNIFFSSFIHQWPLLGPGLFFSLVIFFYTVPRTSWTGDQPVARPLLTHRTSQTQNKRTQTSMSRVGFEPTIPVFEQGKTVHALDSAPGMIDLFFTVLYNSSKELYTGFFPGYVVHIAQTKSGHPNDHNDKNENLRLFHSRHKPSTRNGLYLLTHRSEPFLRSR
jgi:hypothetical protein